MPVLGSPALSFLDTLCSQHTDCYQTFTRCVSLPDDAVHSAGEKGGSRSLSRPKSEVWPRLFRSGRRDSPCLLTCNAVANISPAVLSGKHKIVSIRCCRYDIDTTAVCVRYDNLLLCLNLQCVVGLSRVEMSAGAASSSGAAAASAPVAPPRVRGLEGQLGNNDHLAMYLCLFLTVSAGGPQEGWRSMR